MSFLTSFNPSLELEKLAIQNSQLIELPSNFHKIASSIKYLDLHQNSISYIPQDFYGFDSLEILDLASNDLEFLPDSLSSVTTLKVISIKDNSFKYIATAWRITKFELNRSVRESITTSFERHNSSIPATKT